MITKTERYQKKLGDILLNASLITSEQLDKSLLEQKRTGEKLGDILMKTGAITDEMLTKILSLELKVNLVTLDETEIEKEVINLLPEDLMRKYQVLPIKKKLNVLTLAMIDPTDIQAIDEVIRITHAEIEPVICTRGAMTKTLNKLFGTTGVLTAAIKDINEEYFTQYGIAVAPEDELSFMKSENTLMDEQVIDKKGNKIVVDPPTIKFVDQLLIHAIKEGASDIHIEPEEKKLMIRYRIDGVLQEIPSPQKGMQYAIISRIKIMSRMDIAKMRIPQDGRFDIKVDRKEIGFRVSSYPTNYGENIVLRILDKSTSNYTLEDIGLNSEDRETLTSLITKNYGFILSTGPTGSGKTTTIYSLLKIISSIEKNIITIEDPIEYTIDLVRQSQVNPKAGLTFSTGLRSILRQDPDIIMVGEIRDLETSVIAIQSALTGHMVLSTLHTNDSASAITRLIDMGTEPYLVASSVTAVIAQRLVRTICEKCKASYAPSQEFLEDLGLTTIKKPLFYRGKGCDHCRNTGFKGRIGIFEILKMNEEIRRLTMSKASSDLILEAARRAGTHTMKEDAIAKALNGMIDINEALSIIKTD